ncbi:NADP-dependent oxidoreductase domain-containing protein [Xylogone sp. PMI_703]|nr:NADP-dependent oxidoreductase domain-containing protein [Xylogone sp. PMI_703]
MSTITLNDGNKTPLLAYGSGTALYKSANSPEFDRGTVDLIKTAIRVGYRHLDTAEIYNTEVEMGVAIKESIAEGLVKREELFVTTKVSTKFKEIEKALDVSLQKLQLDYVDSYLLHTPYWTESSADLQAAWATMEVIKESGKARSIGVSNYDTKHIEATLASAKIIPSINQIEFHPYLRHGNLVPFSKDHGNIATSAYGALAPVTRNLPGPLDETLDKLAEKYGVNKGMVCMRWCIDQNIVVITTSRKEERMKEYLGVFDFKLTPEEIQEISEKGEECVHEELVPRVIQYYNQMKTQDSGS